MSAKITLTNGEERELKLTASVIIDYEKQGYDIMKIGDASDGKPMFTKIYALAVSALIKDGEKPKDLEKILPLGEALFIPIGEAFEEAGLGEHQEQVNQPENGSP